MRHAPHQNGAFHLRQSGWACRLSVCLSVYVRCCSAPSSGLPPHEPGFCALLCSGWASFHVEPMVHSSHSKCWRGGFWPCVACLSPGWKSVAQNWKYTQKIPNLLVSDYRSLSDLQRKFCLYSAWRAAHTIIYLFLLIDIKVKSFP